MLAPLDNEVIFKKAFTDPLVLRAFVRDIAGVDAEFENIETEKSFSPAVGNVDFSYDVYAESTDRRVIAELQKVEYDYHFDRFLHYHNMAVAEQVKTGPNYEVDQEVHTIVLLTSPYSMRDRRGHPVKDQVLISNVDPRNLQGQVREIYGHQLIFLNPSYEDQELPASFRKWFALIRESLKKEQDLSRLDQADAALARAMDLINQDGLTPQERREMIEENQRIATIDYVKGEGRAEGREEGESHWFGEGRSHWFGEGRSHWFGEGRSHWFGEGRSHWFGEGPATYAG